VVDRVVNLWKTRKDKNRIDTDKKLVKNYEIAINKYLEGMIFLLFLTFNNSSSYCLPLPP